MYVRLSVCHKPVLYRNTGRIELVLACRLPCTNHTLCYSKIRVLKITVRPTASVTLSQTVNLDNFSTASRSCCQQNSSTVELLMTPIRQSTSRGCLLHDGQLRPSNSITCDLLWIFCRLTTCLYSFAAAVKILTNIARRAVRLR